MSASTLRRVVRASRFGIEPLENRILLAINSWKSAVSGDWADATKWSLGHIPNSTEDVQITIAGAYTVTHLSGSHVVKSLTTNAAFELNGGKIDVQNGATSVSGKTFTLKGGTLAKTTLSTTGGQFLTSSSSGFLDTVIVNTTINMPASTHLAFAHNVTINAGKSIIGNNSNFYGYDSTDSGFNLLGSGSLVLGGTSGSYFQLYNSYAHQPTIGTNVVVKGFGYVYFYGGTNNGTIIADQNAKQLRVYGATWANKGKIQAVNGSILNIEGTWTSNGTGAISTNASTLNLGGIFSNLNAPTRTGGTINIIGTYDLLNTTLSLNAATGSWNLMAGTIKNGTLSFSGGAQINLTPSAGYFDKITLASNLVGPAGGSLYFFHTLTINSGVTLTINQAALFAYDSTDSGAVLGGAGTVLLTGTSGPNFYLYNSYNHQPQIASTAKVVGFGAIYFYGGTNNGTIEANQSGKTLLVYGSTWTNKGKLSAVNGAILTIQGNWSNLSPGTISENSSTLNLGGTFNSISKPTRTGGTVNITGVYDLLGATLTLDATSGNWNLMGGTIKNGKLAFAGGTLVTTTSGGTLDKIGLNSDLTMPLGTSLYLGHTFTIAAGKKLTGNNSYIYGYDFADGGFTLAGSGGEIVLGGTTGSVFYLYNSYGHAPSIATGVKVHGFGQIYFYAGTNNGTIEADQAGKTLIVYGATWTNKGKLSAINGSTLTIQGTWSSPSPGTISEVNSTINLGGTFNNIPGVTRTGGTINVTGIYDLLNTTKTFNATTGNWRMFGGTLKNGTLIFSGGTIETTSSAGTLDKITLNSNLTMAAGTTLYLAHTVTLAAGVKITNNGGSLGGIDLPDSGFTLAGSGEIILGGTGGATFYLYNGYGHQPVIGSTSKVHGFGYVYFYGGTNNGTIEANVATKTLQVYGTFTNKGVLRSTNGAIMNMTSPSSFTNQGGLNAEGGKILFPSAYTASATGYINIGIGGGGAGTTFGLIEVTGVFTMGGTLNVYSINGFSPANNSTYTAIKYTSKAGAFATSNLNAGNSLGFTKTENATNTVFKAVVPTSNVATSAGGIITLNGTTSTESLSVVDAFGIIIAKRGTSTSVFASKSITGIKINGSDGDDTIVYTGATLNAPVPSTLSGGNGNDSMTGSAAVDSIQGDGGNDSLIGNSGNDVLVGGAGNDTQAGGSGDDRYVFGNASTAEADVVDEGSNAGVDTLDFSTLTGAAITGKLNSDTLATHTNRTLKTKTLGTFVNFENFFGGNGNDSLTGNSAKNLLKGNDGNDTFFMAGDLGKIDTGDGGNGTDILGSGDSDDIKISIP